MIVFRSIEKEVPLIAGGRLKILQAISLYIPAGQFVAVMGPSGSGKSTLLGLAAGLDQPSRGEIWVAGVKITSLKEDALALLRGQKIGFIFQAFNLISNLTALENVAIPLEIANDHQADKKAQALLAQVGLAKRMHHYPAQLSGGEQQRVAIARAFARTPAILLADEPTGNLDSQHSKHIVQLLQQLHQQHKVTLLLVTHDPSVASATQRLIQIDDGKIKQDSAPLPLPDSP